MLAWELQVTGFCDTEAVFITCADQSGDSNKKTFKISNVKVMAGILLVGDR